MLPSKRNYPTPNPPKPPQTPKSQTLNPNRPNPILRPCPKREEVRPLSDAQALSSKELLASEGFPRFQGEGGLGVKGS